MQMPDTAVASVRADLDRHPVAVLRNRSAAGTAVAALGRAMVAGVDVEQVRLRSNGIDVTLGVHPATGLIHSMAFVDRAPEGRYGTFLVVYDDYQPRRRF